MARAVARLDEFWTAHGLALELQSALDIAVEEIVSNAIRHGSPGDGPISLHAVLNAEGAAITIEDGGSPFDPLAHPLPDPELPLEARRGGGLGILMVRKIMDEVRYERRAGRNHIRMRKRLHDLV